MIDLIAARVGRADHAESPVIKEESERNGGILHERFDQLPREGLMTGVERDVFRESFRAFVEREIRPHHEAWEEAGRVDKTLFRRAGDAGFLGLAAPERFGGLGAPDFRFNATMIEEVCKAGVLASGLGLVVQNDVCLPYYLDLTDEEQKSRWLPGICSGEYVTAIAMTEPDAGSDLAAIRTTARREGDVYILNGSKTFITNGLNADLVIVACKTAPEKGRSGTSLLVVEAGMQGFRRGRRLEKVGQHAQDTAELFFDDVRVPAANRLGEEGAGFRYLVDHLPQERLSVAITAIAHAEVAFEQTLTYVRTRRAFGQPIGAFQHNRFKLAEMFTELEIAKAFIVRAVDAHNAGSLTGVQAAQAKWWCTELNKRVLDACVQLHGGYGYMEEYAVARAWRDGRIMTIYGGTTEIMKEIIGRHLGV